MKSPRSENTYKRVAEVIAAFIIGNLFYAFLGSVTNGSSFSISSVQHKNSAHIHVEYSTIQSGGKQLSKRSKPVVIDANNTSIAEAYAKNCTPTPWLMKRRTADVPYFGLHNTLDTLLSVQSLPVGEGYKGVSLLFFNYQMSTMLQNCLYSMVKFAGVCNYIVVVWDEPSLEVCRDMNLPCYNATDMIPGGVPIAAEQEAKTHSRDYNKITWMKPITVQAILKKGYAVHASDIDISYLPKDLWKSYMKYIAEVDAIAAFQRDTKHPYIVNTGNYVILPTAAGRKFMATWVATADAAIDAGNHEQHALGELYHATKGYSYCTHPSECKHEFEKHAQKVDFPIVRRTLNPWGNVYGGNCAPQKLESLYPAHPCSYPHLYFHVLCLSGGSKAKIDALKKAGLWFMDDFGEDACPPDAENPHTVRCKPLAWRLPTAEESFQECSYKDRLAFRYFQVHDGVAFTNYWRLNNPAG